MEPRLEVPTPTGDVLGVVVPSGVLGVQGLLSLSLLALLCIFMLEGDSSTLESGIRALMGLADLNVFGGPQLWLAALECDLSPSVWQRWKVMDLWRFWLALGPT